jgi:hypothetical protein
MYWTNGIQSYSRHSNLNILPTSRQRPQIGQYLFSCKHINAQAAYSTVNEELRKVIRSGVSTLARHKDYPKRVATEVARVLEQRAERTFLCVGIACDLLQLRGVLASEPVTTLKHLPRGLHCLYSQLLHAAIKRKKHNEATRYQMLGFIITSGKPLTVEQLCGACHLYPNKD